MTTQIDLGFAPNEDPFVVAHGGFYRRWLSMLDDVEELKELVARLEGTTEDKWVPLWAEVARRYEDEGDRLEETGNFDGARRAYLQAKTYYAIGRFPGEISEVKTDISHDCARAYLKACAHLDPPMEVVDFEHDGLKGRAHFRAPVADTPAPKTRRNLLFSSTSRKERERAQGRGSEPLTPPDLPAPDVRPAPPSAPQASEPM